MKGTKSSSASFLAVAASTAAAAGCTRSSLRRFCVCLLPSHGAALCCRTPGEVPAGCGGVQAAALYGAAACAGRHLYNEQNWSELQVLSAALIEM